MSDEMSDEMREALVELVALKKHKDSVGKDAEYQHRQPIAWQKAEAALASKPHIDERVFRDARRDWNTYQRKADGLEDAYWNEIIRVNFLAMLHWYESKASKPQVTDKPCPHVYTGKDGTSHCTLAASEAERVKKLVVAASDVVRNAKFGTKSEANNYVTALYDLDKALREYQGGE